MGFPLKIRHAFVPLGLACAAAIIGGAFLWERGSYRARREGDEGHLFPSRAPHSVAGGDGPLGVEADKASSAQASQPARERGGAEGTGAVALPGRFPPVDVAIAMEASCYGFPMPRPLTRTGSDVVMPLEGHLRFPRNVHVVHWALYAVLREASVKLVAEWQGVVPVTYRIYAEKYNDNLDLEGEFPLDEAGGVMEGWPAAVAALQRVESRWLAEGARFGERVMTVTSRPVREDEDSSDIIMAEFGSGKALSLAVGAVGCQGDGGRFSCSCRSQ